MQNIKGSQKVLKQPEIKILKNIKSDLDFLRQRIVVIEEEIDAISTDIHEVRHNYLKKLKRIGKKGRFLSFKKIEDLKKSIEVS